MSTMRPQPVVFDPLFVTKPWGGRELERLFGKRLPAGERIGESWEIADLPNAATRVRDGEFRGMTLGQLIERFGDEFFPRAALRSGRFPLLFKFLDARETLSLQVHPKHGMGRDADVKHEAWLVLDAKPGATLFAGFKSGVTPTDAAQVAGTAGFVDLLRAWPARRGDVFVLPSGTPHALGAGIVVAEAQTSSDVTYRLYDWGRSEPGRELHIDDGLANVMFDIAPEIIQPRRAACRVSGLLGERMATNVAFDWLRFEAPVGDFPAFGPAIWICTSGSGKIKNSQAIGFGPGDVLFWPAVSDCGGLILEVGGELHCILNRA